eukprot:530373-Ditylum_brightwellii.AAC.1
MLLANKYQLERIILGEVNIIAELGHAIQVLDLHCPRALETPCDTSTCNALSGNERKSVEDKADIEVDVDLIDSQTFAQLDWSMREKNSLNGRGDNGGGVW